MNHTYFKDIENSSHNTKLNLDEVVEQLVFNEQGLIPVITQDVESKKVLMFAWMNRESLAKTLSTKRVTYWSRSRQSLWIKGETSGHTQSLVSMDFDCDGDVILCQVKQIGALMPSQSNRCSLPYRTP